MICLLTSKDMWISFFQDCVSEDYSSVNIWMGDLSFERSGLPDTVEEYLNFLVKEHIFLDQRNRSVQELEMAYDQRRRNIAIFMLYILII